VKNKALFIEEKFINHESLVIVTHGIAENSLSYHSLAQIFNDHGYSVLLYDLRGHGRSPGLRGHIGSFKTFLNDLHRLVEKYRPHFQKIILLGHSLGAGIVNSYCVTWHDVEAAIVSGNAMITGNDILKFRHLPGFIAFFLRVKTNFQDPFIQSSQPKLNPYNLKNFNFQLVKQAIYYNNIYFNQRIANYQVPVLMLYGQLEDQLLPNISQNMTLTYDKIHSLKKLVCLTGLKHNIYHEDNIDFLYQEIFDFLDKIKK
jgi:alpha-beta hydrolase superfamily lysophospholipase